MIIKEGDKVLVKKDESKKMSDMPYNTTPSIEFDKKRVNRDCRGAKCYLSHEEHLVFRDGADNRPTRMLPLRGRLY